MIGIIKNLFKKEQKEEVKLENLEIWLEKRISSIKERLSEQLRLTNGRIQSGAEYTKQKLNDLEQAGLMNPNIPERAKHFMKGNKDEYKRRITVFLQSLAPVEDLAKWDGFKSHAHESFKELAQGIQRPQQILNEFLANETKATNETLNQLETHISVFTQKLHDSDYFELLALRDSIEESRHAQKRLAEIDDQIKELEKAIQETEHDNRALNEEIELLKRAKSLRDLQEKQQSFADKKKLLETDLKQKFSIVETALRKYGHISNNSKALCDSYADDPVNALTKDLHLSILTLFYDIKKAVQRDILVLKEKKKARTLYELDSIDKAYLGKFLTDYGNITKEQKSLTAEIQKLDVVTLTKIKKDKVIQNTEQVIQLQADLKRIAKEKQKLDGKDPKKELKKLEKICSVKLV